MTFSSFLIGRKKINLKIASLSRHFRKIPNSRNSYIRHTVNMHCPKSLTVITRLWRRRCLNRRRKRRPCLPYPAWQPRHWWSDPEQKFQRQGRSAPSPEKDLLVIKMIIIVWTFIFPRCFLFPWLCQKL